MGHADNITNATFDKAAKVEKQTVTEAMMKTLELLKLELGEK